MKTVTKYICEVTNKEFATEKEAKECEQFEQRVQEAAAKQQFKQLTVQDLYRLSGNLRGDLFLRLGAGLLPIRKVYEREGAFYLETGFATGDGGCLPNSALFRELSTANFASLVFLKVGPSDLNPVKVVGLTGDVGMSRCAVDVAYNAK